MTLITLSELQDRDFEGKDLQTSLHRWYEIRLMHFFYPVHLVQHFRPVLLLSWVTV